jgi:hypothetical protein
VQLRWFHAVDFHLKPEGASREWVVEVNTDCVFVERVNNTWDLATRRIGEAKNHANFEL